MSVCLERLPSLTEIQTELARRHLADFIRQAWHVVEPSTPYMSGWHIDVIAEHLEAVTCGEIRTLLINIPPRHMKSLSVAVFWPAWEWATSPHIRWLFASYAESLSVRDSLKCRRLIQSLWYQTRWGDVFRLAGDQNMKTRFDNDKTGYRLASSVGGAITGEGGDRLVADDPNNVKEAESETIRQGVLTWWDEVMSTRGNDPKTVARVVVQQRSHEEDLTGHLLGKGGYHHLCLPARFEPRVQISAEMRAEHAEPEPHDDCPFGADPRQEGELLWPARFGEPEIAQLESDLGTYAAAGQLQMRPVPREGALFHSDWFRPLPPDLDRSSLALVQFWDLAFSEKDSADYTAAVTVGIDAKRTATYVLHVFRGRVAQIANADPAAAEAATNTLAGVMASVIGIVHPHLVGVEEGAYKQASTNDLIRRVYDLLAARRIAVPVVPVKVTTDKVFRAQLPAGRAQAGLVYADRTAPWWQTFESEHLKFPKGSHDDLVDAHSGATQLAIEASLNWAGQKPQQMRFGR